MAEARERGVAGLGVAVQLGIDMEFEMEAAARLAEAECCPDLELGRFFSGEPLRAETFVVEIGEGAVEIGLAFELDGGAWTARRVDLADDAILRQLPAAQISRIARLPIDREAAQVAVEAERLAEVRQVECANGNSQVAERSTQH